MKVERVFAGLPEEADKHEKKYAPLFKRKSGTKWNRCLYWVFVGWWVEPLILLFITVPRLIFNAAKPRTKTHAVCQTCGHSLTVR